MVRNQKIIATIEARMTSSRLPGKVLLPLVGKPALQRMIERVKMSKNIDDVVVATTINRADDPIVDLCTSINCSYFRGSEDDVMQRVLDAAKNSKADLIVELTGDCPLIDPDHINQMINFYINGTYDYVYNRLEKGLPDGFDVQVFSVNNLMKIERLTMDPIDRVHVSCYFYKHPEIFNLGCPKINQDNELFWPVLAVTLDELEDYELISQIYDHLYLINPKFSAVDVVRFLKKRQDLLTLNANIRRKTIEEG